MSVKFSELPEFDVTEFLTTEEDIAAYLTVVLEDHDPAMLVVAFQDIARARAMTERTKPSNLGHESLDEALLRHAASRLVVISKGCTALGLKLVAAPLHAS